MAQSARYRLPRGFRSLAIHSCLATLLASSSAFAQSYSISSGTGFFVSKYGHIITNDHVVKGCDTVTIRGAVKPMEAQVIANDTEADLALIAAPVTPPRVAPIRFYGEEIVAGDDVMVMGYPREHGIRGEYKVVTSRVIDVAGPMGEPKWLQFEDAAQQGNSGGPLLDLSGNVVGVVVGKTMLVQRNNLNGKEEVVQRSDVAISLPYLIDFMNLNRIAYHRLYSALDNSVKYIEQTAKDYIVNIHCRQ